MYITYHYILHIIYILYNIGKYFSLVTLSLWVIKDGCDKSVR